jgi:hypothetical protein
MSGREIVRRAFGTALLFGLIAPGAAPYARADEAAETEVGVPTPEPASGVAAVEPEPAAQAPAGPASEPGYLTENPPVEAVHRPEGAAGVAAVAADVLVMRPLGLLSLAPGAAAFVLVAPVRAATGGLGDSVDALRERADAVFRRPLGAL